MDLKKHNSVTVCVKREDVTLGFAAEELVKYLRMMDGGLAVHAVRQSGEQPDQHSAMCLGLIEDFGLPSRDLDDPRFDDYYLIRVGDGEGLIAGSNPRSVLLGVYRLLEEAGCRWVRHGADGEYIPEVDVMSISVDLEDAASYRYRGLCIEGAVSYEHMIENIDWAPKAGFNSYMLEFITPQTFFDRWYEHRGNEHLESEPLTTAMVEEFKRGMEQEINKRGLIYQAVGHGWTCEPLGIQGLGWDPVEMEVDDSVRPLLAEVNGTRDLFRGIPLNTNLCYSNPVARQAIVDYAVKHMKANPLIDVV